jgi:hypothetical protein
VRRAVIVIGIAASAPVSAAPDDIVARPLVLAPGQIDAELVMEINWAEAVPGEPVSSAFGQPLSLAPDAWVGITRELTLGVIDSNQTLDHFAAGASFCANTENALEDPLGCHHTYHGSGLDALGSIYDDGRWAIAARARVLVLDLYPDKPAITLGALARWHRGRLAVWGDPYLQLGLANQQDGNRAQLYLPVALSVQPTCHWAIDVRSGVNAQFADLNENWYVPGWVGSRVVVGYGVELGAAVGFPSLLGPQNNVKQRAIFATVGWRS